MRLSWSRLPWFIFIVLGAAVATAAEPSHPARFRPSDAATGSRPTRQAQIDAFNARFRETHNGQAPEQFGIECCQITQIPVSAFTTISNGEVWDAEPSGDGYKYPVAFGNQDHSLWAPIELPSGVVVVQFDIYYYDADPTYNIVAEIWVYPTWDGSQAPFWITDASSDSAQGYGYGPSGNFGLTVNNDVLTGGAQLNLLIYVEGNAPNPNLGFKAVDVWWYRQVSPAPTSATFNDVPTNHPFFRYIEALAASGITGGCGGGNYCPDNAVTRGQIAVFLAKALGLYWQY